MLQFLKPLEPICNKKFVLTKKKCSFWKLSSGLNNRMFCKMTLFLFSNDALLTFSEVPSISLFLHYMQKRCSIWLTFYLLYLSNILGFFPAVTFSIYATSNSHLHSVSNFLNPFLSLSLSPSLALSPLHFTCLIFLCKANNLNDDHHWINWFH